VALVRGLGMRLYNNCVPLCSRDEHYKVELRVPTLPFPRVGIGRDPLQDFLDFFRYGCPAQGGIGVNFPRAGNDFLGECYTFYHLLAEGDGEAPL